MEELLQQILTSKDPSEPMRAAASEEAVLQRLNQNLYSSLFSTYVEDRGPNWTSKAGETALQLLAEGGDNDTIDGWLLEIAYHGNLASHGTALFQRNIARIEQALDIVEQRSLTRSSQYVRGLIAYARDDMTAAEQAFAGLPDLLQAPMFYYQAGYPAFRAPSFHNTLAGYEPSLGLNYLHEPPRKDETSTVLLCSLDERYFIAFAEEFVAQVFDVSTTAHIHFHLIKGAVDPSSLIPSDFLADGRVSITIEETDLPKPERYAIIARYIVLPLVMAAWEKPVLVTDVDLLVKDDPAQLPAEKPVTLGFSGVPSAVYMPTTTVLGGHNLFQPNDGGMAFAQLTSRYLHAVCNDTGNVWVADQIALLMVWRMLRMIVPVGDLNEFKSHRYGPLTGPPASEEEASEKLSELSS